MMRRHPIARTLILLAVIGMVGAPAGGADPLPTQKRSEPPEIRWAEKTATIDVRLDGRNQLRGALVREGEPVAREPVELWQDGARVSWCTSDSKGRFTLPVPSGGLYSIHVGSHRQWCRLWTMDEAPPRAVDQLLIVAGEDVVRGQRPMRELFDSDLFILGAVTAAAIAIPVAIYANRDDRRTGS